MELYVIAIILALCTVFLVRRAGLGRSRAAIAGLWSLGAALLYLLLLHIVTTVGCAAPTAAACSPAAALGVLGPSALVLPAAGSALVAWGSVALARGAAAGAGLIAAAYASAAIGPVIWFALAGA